MTTTDDILLTHRALVKILNAQARNTLTEHIFVRRLPTQIVLENTTEADRKWITKHFPGVLEGRDGTAVRKRGTQRYEQARYLAYLRESEPEDLTFHRGVPRLEVWGIEVPHVCQSFTGRADAKGPVWKCAAYHCGKRITKTMARELGLLP